MLPETIHQMNLHGHGVIVGGGNVYENGGLDVDVHALRELRLDHCPRLRKVILHPKAKVHALEVALCGSYKIDWQRMGPDLLRLVVGGRLTFPLEDVLGAPNLEELRIHEIRKLPPLGFLRRLEKLRMVFAFSAPPGPIWK